MDKAHIEAIRRGDYTLIVTTNDEVVFTSNTFGVIPLLKFMKKNDLTKDYILYDKLTGKAAAMLVIKQGNIKTMYTSVVTDEALTLLTNNKIDVIYNQKVEKILNRNRDDLCPIEKISKSSSNYEELLKKLIQFYQSINVEI